jgi:hypothetical protein
MDRTILLWPQELQRVVQVDPSQHDEAAKKSVPAERAGQSDKIQIKDWSKMVPSLRSVSDCDCCV